MQIELNDDQRNFKDVVARFMADKSPVAAVRELMETDSGFDAAVWQQATAELGLAGTHIPEDADGFGFGPIEVGIIMEQTGQHLFCGPYLASALMAGNALMIGGNDAGAGLLAEIAAGERVATLVLDNLTDLGRAGAGMTVDGDKVSGHARIVLDAQNADVLVVLAVGGKLVAVDASADGVTVTPKTSLDATRRIAEVQLDAASCRDVGNLDVEGINQLWDHLATALAHEMIGGAQLLLDSTIEYTSIRYQFGRPIGAFQALKHRCADLLMELELARAATQHASFCLASGEGGAEVSSMAKAMASDVYMNAAKTAIQLRGGIGFTWENDTHLWYKRAKSNEVLFGTAVRHRDRMIELIEAHA